MNLIYLLLFQFDGINTQNEKVELPLTSIIFLIST